VPELSTEAEVPSWKLPQSEFARITDGRGKTQDHLPSGVPLQDRENGEKTHAQRDH